MLKINKLKHGHVLLFQIPTDICLLLVELYATYSYAEMIYNIYHEMK